MIQIDGDTVKVIKQEVVRTVKTEDFIREVANQAPVYFPLMPANTKGFVASSGATGIIVEQTPRTQLIKYNGLPSGGSSRIATEFNVHLPYTYFVILLRNTPLAIEHIHMFFSKSMVTKEDDEIGWMLLPNLRPNAALGIAEMCGGEIRVGDNQTLPNFVSDLIAQIWGSLFNRDLVNIGNDGARLIVDAMDKVYTLASIKAKLEVETVAKRKKELLVILNPDEPAARYLYAWEQISESMDLGEFIEKIAFPHTWTYLKVTEGIKQFCHRGAM